MFVEQLNDDRPKEAHHVKIEGELCPFCRQEYKELSDRYDGDWAHVVKHVQVRRLLKRLGPVSSAPFQRADRATYRGDKHIALGDVSTA